MAAQVRSRLASAPQLLGFQTFLLDGSRLVVRNRRYQGVIALAP
jgi:hypothetical protein